MSARKFLLGNLYFLLLELLLVECVADVCVLPISDRFSKMGKGSGTRKVESDEIPFRYLMMVGIHPIVTIGNIDT